MPNIATVLKEEIVRLARKELRAETENLKKASSQYRSDIAALKRRAAELEKQVARLVKVAAKATLAETQPTTTKIRFSAKSLQAQRKRLKLSAREMGLLVGVSEQSIYNWEAEKARPREQQMAAIADVRRMGKRDAMEKLAVLAT